MFDKEFESILKKNPDKNRKSYELLSSVVKEKEKYFFEKINFKIKSMDFKDEEVVFEVENMEGENEKKLDDK